MRHRFTNSRGRILIRGSSSGGLYRSKLEKDGFIKWFFDTSLTRVRLQEPRIKYQDDSGEWHRYTGDLSLEYTDASGRQARVIEFKYQRELDAKPWLKRKFELVEAVFRRQGLAFDVLTEADVYTSEFAGKRFIFEHRNSDPHFAKDELLWVAARRGELRLGELVSAVRTEEVARLSLIPEVWRLVSIGALRVNFTRVLNMDTAISFVGTPAN